MLKVFGIVLLGVFLGVNSASTKKPAEFWIYYRTYAKSGGAGTNEMDIPVVGGLSNTGPLTLDSWIQPPATSEGGTNNFAIYIPPKTQNSAKPKIELRDDEYWSTKSNVGNVAPATTIETTKSAINPKLVSKLNDEIGEKLVNTKSKDDFESDEIEEEVKPTDHMKIEEKDTEKMEYILEVQNNKDGFESDEEVDRKKTKDDIKVKEMAKVMELTMQSTDDEVVEEPNIDKFLLVNPENSKLKESVADRPKKIIETSKSVDKFESDEVDGSKKMLKKHEMDIKVDVNAKTTEKQQIEVMEVVNALKSEEKIEMEEPSNDEKRVSGTPKEDSKNSDINLKLNEKSDSGNLDKLQSNVENSENLKLQSNLKESVADKPKEFLGELDESQKAMKKQEIDIKSGETSEKSENAKTTGLPEPSNAEKLMEPMMVMNALKLEDKIEKKELSNDEKRISEKSESGKLDKVEASKPLISGFKEIVETTFEPVNTESDDEISSSAPTVNIVEIMNESIPIPLTRAEEAIMTNTPSPSGKKNFNFTVSLPADEAIMSLTVVFTASNDEIVPRHAKCRLRQSADSNEPAPLTARMSRSFACFEV